MALTSFHYKVDCEQILGEQKLFNYLYGVISDMSSNWGIVSNVAVPKNLTEGVIDLFDIKSNNLELGVEYLLGKNRKYLPVKVSCEEKKDYSRVEKILKKEHPNGKLSKGFLGMAAMNYMRNINY